MNEEEKIRILIVDDEESIVSFLKMGLEMEGYEIKVSYNGGDAVILAEDFKPSLVILDVMLPGLNGFEVCGKIKSSIDTSIIMLTAREEIDDRVTGLNSGADDYMVKPFSFKELIARINARLRNTQKIGIKNKSSEKMYGDFTINDEAHEIRYKNELIELSPTEYKLLEYLLINNNLALSKSKLLDTVWGYDFYGDINIVEVYIRYLRNKINDKEHNIIKTIRGVGYKIVIG